MTNPPNTLLNLTGKRFGRWLVLGRGKTVILPNGRGTRPYWLCLCDCGTEREVEGISLRGDRSRSCGCLHKEIVAEGSANWNRIHGLHNSPENRIWRGLKSRCENPNTKTFKYYGGRGIKICERWKGRDGFTNFLTDMGPRPSPKHSIDRYPDNDGPYSSENCRWATRKEQDWSRKSQDGESSRNAKLTNADVAAIRESAEFGRILAARFGVAEGTIHQIRRRVTWKHIP